MRKFLNFFILSIFLTSCVPAFAVIVAPQKPVPNVVAKTTGFTVSSSDEIMSLSGSGGYTVTLTSPTIKKYVEFIHDGTSLTDSYIISAGTQTIGPYGSSVTIHTNGQILGLLANGTKWLINKSITKTSATSYSPTMAAFGTVSLQSMYWERDGEDIIINGHINIGTPTASPAKLTFPEGALLNTSKVGTSNKRAFGNWWGPNNANASFPVSTAGPWAVIYVSGDTDALSLSTVVSGAGNFNAENGNASISVNDTAAFQNVRVPILGWLP